MGRRSGLTAVQRTKVVMRLLRREDTGRRLARQAGVSEQTLSSATAGRCTGSSPPSRIRAVSPICSAAVEPCKPTIRTAASSALSRPPCGKIFCKRYSAVNVDVLAGLFALDFGQYPCD